MANGTSANDAISALLEMDLLDTGDDSGLSNGAQPTHEPVCFMECMLPRTLGVRVTCSLGGPADQDLVHDIELQSSGPLLAQCYC